MMNFCLGQPSSDDEKQCGITVLHKLPQAWGIDQASGRNNFRKIKT